MGVAVGVRVGSGSGSSMADKCCESDILKSNVSCDLNISRPHIARHNTTPKHLINVKILNGEIDNPSMVVKDLKCHACDILFTSISSRNRHFKSKKHLEQ